MHEIPIRSFVSSVIVLRETEGGTQVLLLKRTQSFAGEWFFNAGGIENGETAWEAALRELREEIGLTPVAFYSADYCEQFYEPHRDAITVVPVFVAFIDPADQVSLNFEHSAYAWLSFDEAVERVPFGGQRTALRWVEQEFVARTPTELLRIALPSG